MAGFLSLTGVCHCLTVLIMGFLSSVGSNNITCEKFKQLYKEQGIVTRSIPSDGVSGVHLLVCPTSRSCCSQTIEHSLKSLSQKQFQHSVQSTLSLVKNTFSLGTSKFDEFFSVLLDNSKRDLHEMFVQTYGLLYQQNAKIFQGLFTDLKSYYKGKKLNLSDALHEFFVRLLKRMFQLLNAQNTFTSPYLECVVRHMNELKPFGDVPINLSKQVKRAFVAARTFVQGLAIGRDVILAISDIPPTEECTNGLMKMLHCPRCRGMNDVKPCSKYCLNTMKGCLAHHQELNTAWNDYIGALILVANRLEGPFNIESVVEPIDVKISDAIMNFQNNGRNVSNRVFQGCGQPDFTKRRKREAAPEPAKPDDSIEKLAFGTDWKNSKSDRAKPTTALGTSLDRLVRAIKLKIETSKDYWSTLPFAICNYESMSARMEDDANCWNGQEKARYTADIQKDGVPNQGNNPEVHVKQEGNPVVILQIDKLKIITNKLQSAYSGYDVEWIDVEVDASGSGSGSSDGEYSSGSGDDTDTDVDNGSGYKPDTNTKHNRHKKPDIKRRGGKGKKKPKPESKEDGNMDDKSQYYFVVSTKSPHLRTPKSSAFSHFKGHSTSVTVFICVILSLFKVLYG